MNKWLERILGAFVFICLVGAMTFAATYIVISATGQVKNDKLFNRQKIIYDQINKFREKIGEKPLVPNEDLEIMADYYASICMQHGRIDHGYVDGGTIIRASGSKGAEWIYAFDECLAQTEKSLPQTAMLAWLLSDPHRKAIETPENSRMGIGYAFDGVTYYYVLYMTEEP